MRGRIILALGFTVGLAAVLASASFGLTSSLVVRSNATTFKLHDKSEKLKIHAKEPIHVDIRSVTMAGNEVIDWHGHAGPSLLVVKTGSLTVYEADHKACSIESYGAGGAFVHGEDSHKFVAGSEGAEFTIVYLLPDGALPSPISMPAVAGCP